MREIIQLRDYIESLTPPPSNKRRLCRVVAVIDADQFEVQVYQKKPEWMKSIGFPTVVVDPNDLIVSVSSEAKELGIKRLEKGAQAKKRCLSLFIIRKKKRFAMKPDMQLLTKYSYAFRESVLTFFGNYKEKGLVLEKDIQIQRTGNDEVLIDLTKVVNNIIHKDLSATGFDFEEYFQVDFEKKKMFLENRVTYENEQVFTRMQNLQKSKGGKQKTEFRLGIGGFIIMQLCDQVEKETKIVCSGGVGTNKIFSKLACKHRKPKSVAVMTREGFNRIRQDMPFREITGFGGHLGLKLERCFGKNSSIAHLQKMIQTSRGISLLKTVFKMEAETICQLAFARRIENVEHKLMDSNVNCGKKNLRITNKSQFKTTLTLLAQNMSERLQEEVAYNRRVPSKITLEYNVKSEGKRTFDVTPSEIPQEKALDFKDLLDESVETVIRSNPDLESDALGIDFIKFCASGFKECTETFCISMCTLITPAY